MLKRLLAIATFVLLGFTVPAAQARTASSTAVSPWQRQTLASLQRRAFYLERVMHRPLTSLGAAASRTLQAAKTPRSRDRLLIAMWERLYQRTQAAYDDPPFYAELSCIHRGEGTWNDTRNPVYDGGLQMNLSFEARYGGFLLRLKGRAYNWTPLEQMWTAVYAIRGPDHRGFYPWPNTARACNLL